MATRFSPQSGRRRRVRSGMALLLVLASLVLLSTLLLSFLSRVKSDQKSSVTYARGSEVKLLADSVLNLVMGQIKAATAGKDGSGGDLAWASQPGMIRTFDTSGSLSRAYKLYSWSDMVTTSVETPSQVKDKLKNWSTDTALYTDLNAPVLGKYPILDPRAVGKVEGFTISTDAPKTVSQIAPMPTQWLYVLQDGSIVSPTGGGATATVSGATAENPIVGRVAFWTDDETCKVNINTASEGTYWDVPSYLTHTELGLGAIQPVKGEYQRYPGHPFTTCLSPILGAYSCAPFSGTTSLPIDPTYATTFPFTGSLTVSASAFLKAVYGVIPRVAWDGSKGGTVNTLSISAPVALDGTRLYASVDELVFSPQRPNGNLIEGGSAANRLTEDTLSQVKFFLTASSRAPEVNLYNKPKVTIWPIDDPTKSNPVRDVQGDAAKGLDDQRSPMDKLIAFASTFGTGANAKPFYFTRNNPLSPSDDWTARNLQLYDYLQRLMERPVPGFGNAFNTKYPQDYQQILTEIVDYVRSTFVLNGDGPNVTAPHYSDFLYAFSTPPVYINSSGYERVEPAYAGGTMGGPGTGVDPSNKGATGQIVPLIHPNNGTKGFGRFPTIGQVGLMFIVRHISPKAKSGTTNYVKDGSGVWSASGTPSSPLCPAPFLSVPGDYLNGTGDPEAVFDSTLPNGAIRMQAIFLMEPYYVTPGLPPVMPDYRISVDGLQDIVVDGAEAGFPGTGTLICAGNPETNRNYKCPSDAITPVTALLAKRELSTTMDVNSFPFYAQNDAVARDDADTFLLTSKSGGGIIPLKITISGNGKNGSDPVKVQELTVNFPANVRLPRPNLPNTLPTYVVWSGWPPPTFTVSQYSVRHFGANPNGRVGRFGTGWLDENGVPHLFLLPRDPTAGNNNDLVDTVWSVEIGSGDARLVAGRKEAPVKLFGQHVGFGQAQRAAHSFRFGRFGGDLIGGRAGRLAGTNYSSGRWMVDLYDYRPFVGSNCDPGGSPPKNPDYWASGGDWDNGIGRMPDGPYINKADEGTRYNLVSEQKVPYFGYSLDGSFAPMGANLSSPSRVMPSPVMFGSLPTGVMSERPFQTLLFCPNPRAGAAHFALQSGPRDHLLLDLFHMPVVEPYAISEPFSTAGKINMNYQIQPFTYIKRDTGLRSVLKAVKLAAVPDARIADYKGIGIGSDTPAVPDGTNFRYNINATETLKAFDDKFSSNTGIFRSASEICDVFLYPDKQASPGVPEVSYAASGGAILSWWNNYKLTGDNIRERPYALIYPRLTTKSNTFTVHMRVQKLQKIKTDPAQSVWNEGRDVIAAEYRGLATVERYIDPNNPNLPDFADAAVTQSIDEFYKFRVVNVQQFAP